MLQCIVTKGHFPANQGRIKKATNGHIGATNPPPSLSFSRNGEHSRYTTALYKDRDRVSVCFLDCTLVTMHCIGEGGLFLWRTLPLSKK